MYTRIVYEHKHMKNDDELSNFTVALLGSQSYEILHSLVCALEKGH